MRARSAVTSTSSDWSNSLLPSWTDCRFSGCWMSRLTCPAAGQQLWGGLRSHSRKDGLCGRDLETGVASWYCHQHRSRRTPVLNGEHRGRRSKRGRRPHAFRHLDINVSWRQLITVSAVTGFSIVPASDAEGAAAASPCTHEVREADVLEAVRSSSASTPSMELARTGTILYRRGDLASCNSQSPGGSWNFLIDNPTNRHHTQHLKRLLQARPAFASIQTLTRVRL